MIDANKYLKTYFQTCKLVGKVLDPYAKMGERAPKKTNTPGKVSLSKSVPVDKFIYVFLLPKTERDVHGKRVYGALYPDSSPMIWPRHWAKNRPDGALLEVDEEDREYVRRYRKYLLSPVRQRLRRQYQHLVGKVKGAEASTIGGRARKMPLKKDTRVPLKNKGRVPLMRGSDGGIGKSEAEE